MLTNHLFRLAGFYYECLFINIKIINRKNEYLKNIERQVTSAKKKVKDSKLERK